MRKPTDLEWIAFQKEQIINFNEETGSNLKDDFNKISKKYALAYYDYLKSTWISWQSSLESFCKINGNVPISFFEKHILPTIYSVKFKRKKEGALINDYYLVDYE